MLASTVLTELRPSPEMTLSLVKYRKLEIKSLQADVFKSRCCLHSDQTQPLEIVLPMVNEF